VFLIDTEAQTDPVLYEKLVGIAPGVVATAALERRRSIEPARI